MELFRQALTIMTLGMALVFLFLLVVIQCMNFTAFLIRRHEARHPAAPEQAAETAVRARLAAAIAAATDLKPAQQ
jgi:sodium pump decarboxylase gamma subunit